jgi:hypothetical protein
MDELTKASEICRDTLDSIMDQPASTSQRKDLLFELGPHEESDAEGAD